MTRRARRADLTRSLLAGLIALMGAAAIVLLATGEDADSVQAASSKRWVAAAPSPLTRSEVGAARIGRFVYVVGGFLSDGQTTAQVARYDLDSDEWTTTAPMPVGLNHAAVAAFRGRLYVYGGYTGVFGGDESDGLYRYDPGAKQWAELQSGARRAAATLAVCGKRLYAIGGARGGEALRQVQIYDPAADDWSRGPKLHVAREHLASGVVGGRIFVIGGRAGGENLRVVERLDPEAGGGWDKVKPVHSPRSGFQAARVGPLIVAVGGEQLSEGDSTIAPVEAYDTRTGRWRKLAAMLTPRHGLGVVADGRRVFALEGGPQPGFAFSNLNEFLDVPRRLLRR